jgi:hypothetical protein
MTMNRSSPAGGLPEEHSELRADTVHALRMAVTADRRVWHDIERIVREYVRVLRTHGLKADRGVAEVKALVIEATRDPMSNIIASAETWALSEYYDK